MSDGDTVFALATGAVLTFFQLLPHPPVGVSEVHLILGSTLFLVLGAGPAALGLALGLLLQGKQVKKISKEFDAKIAVVVREKFAALSEIVGRRMVNKETGEVSMVETTITKEVGAVPQRFGVAWDSQRIDEEGTGRRASPGPGRTPGR